MEREQELLEQLRNSRDPVAHAEAGELQSLYHTRQMALLADDVYDAAKETGTPPPGWTRATDDMDRLREFVPGLSQRQISTLQDQLTPKHSGFRAEIYLPDPEMKALGYRPTMAVKGSGGEVMTAHGLRDTTIEDHFANNLPQAVGMETDYYDRSMRLGTLLKLDGFRFEHSGHSLGGSGVTASSTVTGMPATTFNAAGLNPETPRRFAQQHGHIRVYDTAHSVNAYEVQGDLLTQGVQGTLHDMSAVRRAELGNVLQEVSRLAITTPEGRAFLQQKLDENLPPWARPTAMAFVAKLADGDVEQMLRDLPQTQGQIHALPAMMQQDGRLVPRPDGMPLAEIMARTGPLWETLDAAAYGAHVGRGAGEDIAGAGRGVHELLRREGDALCAAGNTAGNAFLREHQTVATALDAVAFSQQEAPAVVLPGQVATTGLDAVPWLERGLANAERWLGGLERDAIAKPACGLGQAWNAEGRAVENVGNRAPEVGVAVGAAVAGGSVSALELGPLNAGRDARAVDAMHHVEASAAESLDRHSIQETVLPSIDAKINHAEQRARETLQYDAALHAARAPMQAGDGHAARRSVHAVFKGLAAAAMRHDVEGMRGIERAQMHSPLMQHRQVQGQELLMQQQAQLQQQQMQQRQGPSLHR
jgi:hypothetical protein